MSFYIISGCNAPCIMEDEAGEYAVYSNKEEAIAAAEETPMCQAFGYVVVEMKEGLNTVYCT